MSRGVKESILQHVVPLSDTVAHITTLEVLMKSGTATLRAGLLKLIGAHRAGESRKPTLTDLAREHPPSQQYIAYLMRRDSGVVSAIARAFVSAKRPALVNLVHVVAAYRGQGLCGRVMRALLAGTPARHFELLVNSINKSARACYVREGFVLEPAAPKQGRYVKYSRSVSAAERTKMIDADTS